ncbi:MAG: DUF1090 domain-containing protein [Glaciimonas sp.]|nr:DUF1090 domain-containing protein [Glaciimonas sp.]
MSGISALRSNMLTLAALACLSLSLFSAQVQAATNLGGCDIKRQHVQEQIEHSRLHRNRAQEARLNMALNEINTHCTEAGMRQEREEKIAQKEAKLMQRKTELQQAQVRGDVKKIAQKQRKVEDAEIELRQAKEELS